MSTVTEIKEAIDRLTPREYCEPMSALHPFEDDDWDRQMNADAAAGKFVAMNERVERCGTVACGGFLTSLKFKKVGAVNWPVRIGLSYRAIGKFSDDGPFLWEWIGTHADYDKRL